MRLESTPLVSGIMMTAGAKAYVYGYVRTLCDLYLVEGLK